MARKNFSKKVQAAVAAKCQRICALCFAFEQDARPKNGQFAHVDRDSSNNAEANAAYLCPNHHAYYDTTSRQTARVTSHELRRHQETLWAYLKTIRIRRKGSIKPRNIVGRVGLDVYDRRLPIYRKARQFVRDVAEKLQPEIQMILKFATETDEALFLFDEHVAEYLDMLFKKALRLNTVELIRKRMATDPEEAENFQALVNEEIALAEWFADQPEQIRVRFAPFLSLS